ncbi:EscU/YscU/HrcU family type III secretion system export apparatus switch protein [Pseudoalteromonas sp. SMS1]|uniref:EscU/YscU/HrcU family type III secretion system export apparatus switch protein n=1 Tax=Pseudoalteromonas sp. SMS1 TaxID=2908894 RepID=UPI001F24FF75|nr:EscU/YscU/HrcU family type III secretion system export apparatus switch protein [Pseudoalteromonas sp. SMS1]MCF2860212.1 EscU/YscU/HrcU family type III secretion system export apparatus switch protein [Pseudoalteromonas sp. SMS1]
MSQEQDKSEKPTPYKLEEAKKKGQVNKSQELNLIFTGGAFVAASFMFGDVVLGKIADLFRHYFFIASGFSVNAENLVNLFNFGVWSALSVFLPLLLIVLLVGISITIMQTGFIFTSYPMKPDFKKINPVSGFKKIFSKKTLFELIKSILKLSMVGGIFYLFYDYIYADINKIGFGSEQEIKNAWFSIFAKVAGVFFLAVIPFVLLDVLFNKWDFMNKMKMSKREVKDEHKKKEGDPEVKQKQKQNQKELLMKSAALSQVKDSDVVINNPTHISIALKYDKEKMIAPQVVAMGKGEFAFKIRKQARKYSVPMIQNKKLARKLYKECQLNEAVPMSCFKDIAPVFRWLLGMETKTK